MECFCGSIAGLLEWKDFLGMQNSCNKRTNSMETLPLFSVPEALCFVHFRERLNNMKRRDMEENRKAEKV